MGKEEYMIQNEGNGFLSHYFQRP